MGPSGGGSSSDPSAAALAQISQQLFAETDPLRQALIGRSEQFLGLPGGGSPSGVFPGLQLQPGNLKDQIQLLGQQGPGAGTGSGTSLGQLDIRASPLFIPQQQAINRGFQTARQGIIEDLPAGGALLESLSDLSIARGRDLSDLEGQLAEDELGRAFALATGQPLSQSIAGLGRAGAIEAQLSQAEAQRQAGIFGALGAGAGEFFGAGGLDKGVPATESVSVIYL